MSLNWDGSIELDFFVFIYLVDYVEGWVDWFLWVCVWGF